MNWTTRFGGAFFRHASLRLRGETMWSASQITLADSLARRLRENCSPVDSVIHEKHDRDRLFEGIKNHDIKGVTGFLEFCKVISRKPECCDTYLDALSATDSCHPPIIGNTLKAVFDEQVEYDKRHFL